MDFGDLIPVVAIFFVIGVPITAAAIRWVIHPVLRDLIEAVRGKQLAEDEDLQARLARLEETVHRQGEQMERLVEAELFRRRLESGGAGGEGESRESRESRGSRPAGVRRTAAPEPADTPSPPEL